MIEAPTLCYEPPNPHLPDFLLVRRVCYHNDMFVFKDVLDISDFFCLQPSQSQSSYQQDTPQGYTREH